MPLFPGPQNQEGTVWEPQAADTRLAQTAGATYGVFTSDLTVSEYVLLGEAGFEPLGFVVGSSIYHVGLQISRWGQNQELQVLTQAMYSARELAMARMRAEADHLGADGIVGVQLRMQMYAWGQACLEFVATGTAVRALAGEARTARLTGGVHLGPVRPGLLPAAGGRGGAGRVRARHLVYHIAHRGMMQSLRQAYQNQEMAQFTQGVYEARERALGRMQAEAADARSSGIVGVTVDVQNHVWVSTRPSSWPPAPRSGGSPRAQAAADHAQADVHPRAGQLTRARPPRPAGAPRPRGSAGRDPPALSRPARGGTVARRCGPAARTRLVPGSVPGLRRAAGSGGVTCDIGDAAHERVPGSCWRASSCR